MKLNQIKNLAILISLGSISGIQSKPVGAKVLSSQPNEQMVCVTSPCPRHTLPKLDRRIEEEEMDKGEGSKDNSKENIDSTKVQETSKEVPTKGKEAGKDVDKDESKPNNNMAAEVPKIKPPLVQDIVEVPKVSPPLVLEKDKIPDGKQPKLEARNFVHFQVNNAALNNERRSEMFSAMEAETENEIPITVIEGEAISGRPKGKETFNEDISKPLIPGEKGVPDAPHPKL